MSEFATFSSGADWFNLGMCTVCILCAGLAAGLTIGLVSVDKNELRLLAINGTDTEKLQAKKIIPLIKDHHWLLVTLFLFNAVANEALPIFLSSLVPEYAAIILATFSVLIFGEIIPSSIFSGPRQLEIAASLSGVVKFLMILFYIIARPIGLILDYWLGKHQEEEAPFDATDLYTLLSLSRHDTDDKTAYNAIRTPLLGKSNAAHGHNHNHGATTDHRAPAILLNHDDADENLLDDDSVAIAQGAIICSREYVEQIVQTFYHHVDAAEVVDINFFQKLGRCGFSRLLVRDGESILGYIIVKELLCNIKVYLNIGVVLAAGPTTTVVSQLPIHKVQYFNKHSTVLEALNEMQCGISRIAVVTSDGSCNSSVIGYFSLEDIIEEIIQEEVSDEKDTQALNMKTLQRNNSYKWLKNKHLERSYIQEPDEPTDHIV